MADAVEALPPPISESVGVGGPESGRSSPSPTASPEFEFWMVGRNPSAFPAPALLTADELFSGGVVLPLHNLQAPAPEPEGDAEGAGEDDAKDADTKDAALPGAEGEDAATQPLAESGIAPTPDLPAVTFKWKDIFKAGGDAAKDRKKGERRVSSVSGNAELININIWPFSRSRSAGHSAAGAAPGSSSLTTRAKPNPNPNASSTSSANANNANASATSAPPAPAPAPRKVSSAPCSRSNSRGESSAPPPAVPATAAATVAAAAVAAAAPAAQPPPPAAEEDAAAAQAAPLPAAATTTTTSSATSMLRRLVPGQNRNSNNAGSTGGTGIRVGRPSAVWQLRRNKLQQTAAEQKQASSKKKSTPALAAPAAAAANEATGDDKAAPSVAVAPAAVCRNNAGCSEGAAEEGNQPQGLFGLRTFFSKKVY
ncbi:unnamed protein product [Urochloa decumbens]|uniref:Uncharacterized protein n=1 Tax=Urochloa decumbens TaxID=240449 RepID=A0ABC8YPC6_9POAL